LADYSIALEAQIEKLRQERDQALAQLDEVREELQAERQKHNDCYEALDKARRELCAKICGLDATKATENAAVRIDSETHRRLVKAVERMRREKGTDDD
jgi:uncharacterized coiled-coil DUF342 family protein